MTKTQNILVSVIIPVYNVQDFLEKCVNSIRSQTYPDMEIILVNDGSTDSSPAICQKLAENDPRIRVIHKRNGGLSDARNAGIEIMSGDYVIFVDSDDYLEPEAVENLVGAVSSCSCAISCMRSNLVSEDYKVMECQATGSKEIAIYSAEEYIKGICEKSLSESVCDKLFSAEIFSQRRFETGRLNEDFLFLANLLMEGYSIADIDYAGYNYYQRHGSITKSGFGKSIVDAVKNAYSLKERANAEKKTVERDFARLTLYQARTVLLTMPWKMIYDESEEYKVTLDCMRKSISYLKSARMSNKDKLFLYLVDVCPKLVLRFTSLLWSLKSSKVIRAKRKS